MLYRGFIYFKVDFSFASSFQNLSTAFLTFSFHSPLLKSYLIIARKLGNSYFVNSFCVLITQLCEFRPLSASCVTMTSKRVPFCLDEGIELNSLCSIVTWIGIFPLECELLPLPFLWVSLEYSSAIYCMLFLTFSC